MRKLFCFGMFVVACGMAVSQTGHAQDSAGKVTTIGTTAGRQVVGAAGSNSDNWIARRIFRNSPPGATRDYIMGRMEQLFHESDVDGGGVTKNDHQLKRQLDLARRRANFLIAHWLNYDLDGDGIVTESEVKTYKSHRAKRSFKVYGVRIDPTPEQLAKISDKMTRKVFDKFGTNKKRVTFKQALAAAKKYVSDHASRQLGNLVPLSLDGNRDGVVSRDEFDAAIEKAFSAVDTDGDGRLSKTETDAARQRARVKRPLVH